MSSTPVSNLANYIRDRWSNDGVEVMSQGPRSLTIELPLTFHDFGSLCAGVEQGWDARVDLTAATAVGLGPCATVWLPREAVLERDETDREEADQDETEEPPSARRRWWPNIQFGLSVVCVVCSVAHAVWPDTVPRVLGAFRSAWPGSVAPSPESEQ